MICLIAGGTWWLLGPALTLAWNHSVEKIRWEEDYRVVNGRLMLVEARVQGSGAGMEPPPHARYADGWWRYTGTLPPLERLTLANSDFVPDYQLCLEGACQPLARYLGEHRGPVTLVPCPPRPGDVR